MVNKVVHISLGKANPNRMNGVNKVLNSLLSAQADLELNVEFWGISFSKEHNYPQRNFKTRLFKDSRLKFKLDSELRAAVEKLRNDSTVVHLHGAFLPQLFSVAKLLVKNGIPYVFTPHGGYNVRALQKSKLLKIAYMKFAEGYVVKNAKSVQLIGASEAEGLLTHLKPQSWMIIPNGQEVLEEKIDIKKTNLEVLNIGYLGRIDIQTKGLDILIKALSLVKEDIDIKLTVIGDGGEIQQLIKEVKLLGLTKQVDFKGALFGEEKLKALYELDAFCLVSRNEGLPGVVLEASAVGLPSIVSVQTNMSEYLTEAKAGWVMSDYDEVGLACIFNEVAFDKSNQILESKGRNAKKMIRNVFCWKEIAKNLDGLYAA